MTAKATNTTPEAFFEALNEVIWSEFMGANIAVRTDPQSKDWFVLLRWDKERYNVVYRLYASSLVRVANANCSLLDLANMVVRDLKREYENRNA